MAVKPVQEVTIPEETGEETPAAPQKPAEDRDAALRKRRASAEAHRAGGATFQPIPPAEPRGRFVLLFHVV